MIRLALTHRVVTLAALIVAAMTPPAFAQPKQDLVKTKIIADTTAVKPGSTFTVGVLFEIKPEWHLYWTNPGDSGVPTTVKFEAPKGFTVGEVRYPVPAQFVQPGDLIGYGYTDSLLLMVEVTAPPALEAGSEVTLRAEAGWLCCHDVCIPGRAKLELKLPVSDESTGDNAGVFSAWAGRVPTEEASTPAVGSATWSEESGKPVLTVEWKQPVKDVEFYPGVDSALELSDVSVQTDGARTRVTVTARVLAGQTLNAESLPSVLAYTDADGVRRGVTTEMPLADIASGGGK